MSPLSSVGAQDGSKGYTVKNFLLQQVSLPRHAAPEGPHAHRWAPLGADG